MISSKGRIFGLRNQTKAIELKTASEIKSMRRGASELSKVMGKLAKSVCPGISTKELDKIAFNEIRSLGLRPAFLGYRGYPATSCISVNSELVHGIPSEKRVLKDGDIVSIDLGLIYSGFYADMAATFSVGNISEEAKNLIEVTKGSLFEGISVVNPGVRLGDVSSKIQSFAEDRGYSVVREYVGHGIGRNLHEEPQIPNFGVPETGIRLVPGMVLAFEPMLSVGGWEVKTLDDGWTVETEDGKLCAHFEHMVLVTESGREILTEYLF